MIEKIETGESVLARSKYEQVMIAAREARRLNEVARANGKELKRRVVKVAWERMLRGDIAFTYSAAPPEEELDVLTEEAPMVEEAAPVEQPAEENA